MNKHPYLRAYLAGAGVPTVFLLVVMTGYTIVRYVYNLPVPIERVIVFPMAFVPNLWGLWNLLYVAFVASRRFPIGPFGALLPLVLAPMGYFASHALQFAIPHEVFRIVPIALPVAIILYYLVWKYFVAFLNAELGLA